MRKRSWLRIRQYIHISPRFFKSSKIEDTSKTEKTKNFIVSYVRDPKKVAVHKFSPFLHYKIWETRFRKGKDAKLPNGKKAREHESKPRLIYYSNHLDTQIYAYYANELNKSLRIKYESNPVLNDSVIGYRSIEYSPKRNKCTIDFASEVFDFIRNHQAQYISVYCLDIRSFFDNINHKILKKSGTLTIFVVKFKYARNRFLRAAPIAPRFGR